MNLENYTVGDYKIGASQAKLVLWLIVSALVFENKIFVFQRPKRLLLRLFGCSFGKNLFIKPNVKIKYPWKLTIGDFSSIGEGVWIDNLEVVSIGDNVVISQGAYLLTGNHNYKSNSFDLYVEPIVLEDCVWLGAKTLVGPGVVCSSGTVLAAGAVLYSSTFQDSVYKGNPAIFVRMRY
jgi:putative colanic acid biosynthesis acetyltransferase WcaF